MHKISIIWQNLCVKWYLCIHSKQQSTVECCYYIPSDVLNHLFFIVCCFFRGHNNNRCFVFIRLIYAGNVIVLPRRPRRMPPQANNSLMGYEWNVWVIVLNTNMNGCKNIYTSVNVKIYMISFAKSLEYRFIFPLTLISG